MSEKYLELPYPPPILNPNNKSHWAPKHKSFKKYKSDCALLASQVEPLKEFRITFFPPTAHRRDRDNAISAFKAGQDGLALAWGVDDSEFIITYAPFGAPVKGGKVVISNG